MTTRTLQDAVNLAREIINDEDSTNFRYTDVQMARWCNDGLNEIRQLRPDLFFGQYLTYTGDNTLTLASAFPIDYRYVAALADYLIYRTEMRNDDAVNSGRAMLASGYFEKRLLT